MSRETESDRLALKAEKKAAAGWPEEGLVYAVLALAAAVKEAKS